MRRYANSNLHLSSPPAQLHCSFHHPSTSPLFYNCTFTDLNNFQLEFLKKQKHKFAMDAEKQRHQTLQFVRPLYHLAATLAAAVVHNTKTLMHGHCR